MSDDVLITPASRKIDFKDSSGNVDGTIALSAAGNLQITSTGTIEIGDISEDIHIGNGTEAVDLVFDYASRIYSAANQDLTIGKGTLGGNEVIVDGADVVSFSLAGTEKARFNTTGLGVGTTSPDAKIDIEQTDGAVHGLKVYRNDSSTSTPLVFMHDDSVYNDNPTLHVRTDRADQYGTAALLEGRVGIGIHGNMVTAPDQALHVEGSVLIDAFNNGKTTLASNYSDGDTSLVLTDASTFNEKGTGTINGVKFSWTAKSSNTLTVPDLDANYSSGVTVAADTGLFFREGHENDKQPGVTIYDESNSGDTRDDLSLNAYSAIRMQLNSATELKLVDDRLTLTPGNEDNAIFGFRNRNDLGMKETSYSVALMAPEDVYVQIDSNNNNSDDAFFAVTKNASGVGGGTELFKVLETGAITFNQAFTFPTADGSANQVLKTDGSGALSWTDQSGGGGGMTSFQLEDGDSTEVTISDGKEVKFKEGTGIEINWTDTSTGSDGDPYDLQFTVDVSDFMSNGSNNRVVTATGTDAMNAEANLHFNGTGLGIGTSAIPHGGKGTAKLAIEGTNQNVAGPHIQTTTASDDYPLLQVLSWQHDNISINFDAWYTPTDGWTSSDAGSNFQIYKHSDTLKFRYDAGVSADADITWNEGFHLTKSGELDVLCGFRPRKAVISTISSNTVLGAANSGGTFYWTGGSLTLPADATVGMQVVIINNTGSSATPGLGNNNAIASGWTSHAAMADETARTYICPVADKWIYIG